jgi:hypothetical protein
LPAEVSYKKEQMAKREKTTKKASTGKSRTGKVGTDPEALKQVGGKGDFGIPARDNVARARDGEIEGRPAGSAPGYSGSQSVRTTGVGSAGGEPGHDSGGDLDTDFIGFDGHGGLAAKPVGHHEVIDGPDEAGEPSDTFASGKHAAGCNAIKPGRHGSAPSAKGDYVDHSGSDTSTMNSRDAGSVSPQRGEDPGAEGEINRDEATGDVDEGGET